MLSISNAEHKSTCPRCGTQFLDIGEECPVCMKGSPIPDLNAGIEKLEEADRARNDPLEGLDSIQYYYERAGRREYYKNLAANLAPRLIEALREKEERVRELEAENRQLKIALDNAVRYLAKNLDYAVTTCPADAMKMCMVMAHPKKGHCPLHNKGRDYLSIQETLNCWLMGLGYSPKETS